MNYEVPATGLAGPVGLSLQKNQATGGLIRLSGGYTVKQDFYLQD